METYTKDIVKLLLKRSTEKITSQKDAEIKALKDELEAVKLEKELNSEFNSKPQEENETIDIDKILGGLND